jgi:LPS-assembly lipoprotein
MWWPKPWLAALLLAGSAVGLTACGFQPLYGTTASGQRLGAIMDGVEVTPIPGRVGQKLRNELIFANTGGGDAAPTTYKLDIVIKEKVTKQLVKISGDAQQEVYELTANFKLTDAKSNKVVLTGGSVSRAPYERVETIFSNVRARIDAENRAARTVSDSIKVRLAAYLSTAA